MVWEESQDREIGRRIPSAGNVAMCVLELVLG